MEFNIFTQVATELDDFFGGSVHIAGLANKQNIGLRSQGKNASGYSFSQWKTLNKIEMYYNSQFETGIYDSEGQRKVFLNISSFRADVASKQVDLDLKNFVFVPEMDSSVWPAYFAQKEFRQWAKKNYFGQLINDVAQDYPKYGTSVVKRVGDELQKINLLTLRNQIDANSLQDATYVIEEHKEMTVAELQEMKEWDLSELDLSFGKTYTIFERYGHVPLSWYKEQKEETVQEGDDEQVIDVMAIVSLNRNKPKAGKTYGGSLLFMEKVKQRPYQEVHWKRQTGRWLGVGEVENQFENQIVRNLTANMRRRALMWSTKKIFQSTDTELPANLVTDVKDGDVLRIDGNGQVSQVNIQTQNLAEFQANEQMWEQNSNQKSFTFEVATGEALPSGTPFRLGVLLSNAANSHFGLKRENLGLFFKRVVNELVWPVFEKQNQKEKIINLASDEDGVAGLKRAIINAYINTELKNILLSGKIPNAELVRQKITQDIEQRENLFLKRPEGFYKTMKASVDLVITGESVDIPKRIETLTNVFNALSQKGDPRADQVLEKIVAYAGENLEATAGMGMAPQNAAQQPAGAQIQQAFGQQPALEGQATL